MIDTAITTTHPDGILKPLHQDLKSLGESATTNYKFDRPDPSLLEYFPSPFSVAVLNTNQVSGSLHIVSSEFTSLCPKTGQPDFATIVLDYIPNDRCVESKSYKLYLGSYRNFGEFHESCVNRIANDLINLLKPRWLRVQGQFTPRGGIPFWPTAEYGTK
jgi:7-cyano-7-deazaguanine reductase